MDGALRVAKNVTGWGDQNKPYTTGDLARDGVKAVLWLGTGVAATVWWVAGHSQQNNVAFAQNLLANECSNYNPGRAEPRLCWTDNITHNMTGAYGDNTDTYSNLALAAAIIPTILVGGFYVANRIFSPKPGAEQNYGLHRDGNGLMVAEHGEGDILVGDGLHGYEVR